MKKEAGSRLLASDAARAPATAGRAGALDLDPEAQLRLLDALSHEAALEAARDPSPLSPEEEEDDVRLAAFLEALMATPPGSGRQR